MRIELLPDIESRLRRDLRSAGPREIGGMLFAEQLAPSHFRVLDFSVDVGAGSREKFRRDSSTHRQALDAFFERTGGDFAKFNYLGEWHSHPSCSVRPSLEDVATMTELVSDERNTISFAVLLIVRLRLRFWLDSSWTIFACGCPPQALKRS